MTNSFTRKIIYVILAAILLIPLSMITRPSVKNQNEGGVLARLRTEHNLSQAELSEIDPTSATMKLASLGLRGIAVNMLWMQAIDHKKREDYDKFASTLKALTKLQPNFVKVWEFQAHNLAYNVSMEFDDYESRHEWVKKGLVFMKQGVKHNRQDHRMTDMLGFMTGNKYGKSDEKRSFRRMFSTDDTFHVAMSDMIDKDEYNVDDYGPDSWLMAKEWYRLSTNLVEQGARMYRNDVMFFMFKPSQTRNRGLSLQDEHRTGDVIQDVWVKADSEWSDFGERELRNSYGVPFQLNAAKLKAEKIARLRDDLDLLVPPGTRQSLTEELAGDLQISEEHKQLIKIPADQRSEEEQRIVNAILAKLSDSNSGIEHKIAKEADDRKAANLIVREIQEALALEKSEASSMRTINFTFWANRNAAEANPITVKARQLLYDAQQMRRRSIYDDEFTIDYVTKEKSNVRKGAISLYLDAFKAWDEVFKEYPFLQDGPLSDDIAEEMQLFLVMLGASNSEWPNDFPLQWLVDERRQRGEPDKLPTTEDLKERESGRVE